MKQKRTFVTLVLIVALLCLGIAYAAISGVNLTVTGNVSATAADGTIAVEFTDAETTVTPAVGTATAAVDATDSIKATFTVSGLTAEKQTATFLYTITNQSEDMAATLEEPSISWKANGANWFKVDMELAEKNLDEADTEDEGANETTLTVTVTLLKTPVSTDDETDSTDTATITIKANPVENK